jgi:chemotaxis protein CheD
MINPELMEEKYLLEPGYLIIRRKPMIIYGTLGSGVFVGVLDKKNNYSGGCSFLYPKDIKRQYTVKYGNVAICHLVRKMIRSGSSLSDLRAHIIGGAVKSDCDFGNKNVNIAKKVLAHLGIEVIAEDIGGKMARKFIYETDTGQHITMKTHNYRVMDWFPYY